MNSSLRIILSLALPLAGATAFLACGGEDDDGTNQETGGIEGDDDTAGEGTGGLKLVYDPMFSAFEPTHTYQVPVVVEGLPKDLDWTATPADAVMIEPAPEQGGALITMRKSGTVKIKAISRGSKMSGEATLNIQEATPELWEIGQKRYTAPNMGAFVNTDASMFGVGVNENASCNNCHGEASTLKVEHTPQQAAGYSPEELINVFTMAKKPEGAPMRVQNIPANIWQQIHKWKMSEEEQKGIIVYLRSLAPKPTNNMIDFGGLRGLLPEGGIRFPGGGGRRDGGAGRNDAGGGSGDAGTGTVVTPSGMDAGT
jgi:hypothetical protein